MTADAATRPDLGSVALVEARIGDVLQRVNRYWAGEAEVAAAFFSRARSAEEHLRWLKSQMVRELAWPDGRLTRLREAFQQVEHEMDRHAVHTLFATAEEEYSHYVVLADIAEAAAGRRVAPEEIMYNRELPAWKALDGVRTREADWDSAVAGFHEGGGLGIYWTCMQLKPLDGDPYRAPIAKAMGVIYEDEVEHAARGLRQVVRIAATSGEAMWQKVVEKVLLVGYYRVRMRNEQFGFPLTDERVEEIREGKIRPYIPPLPEVAMVYDEIVAAKQ